MTAILWILIAIGTAGAALCLIRAALGPTAPDRIVGVDGMVTVTTALFVVLAFVSGRAVYLDVALVYGVLAFAGVLVVARYLEKGL